MLKKPINKFLLYLFLLFIVGIGFYWMYSKHTSSINISPNRLLSWRDFEYVKQIGNRPSINARTTTYITPTIKKIKNAQSYKKIIPDIYVGIDEHLTQVSIGFMSRSDQELKKLVLNHENGHFKIAQIIAYRILKETEVFLFHPENYQQEFDSLVRTHFIEWKRMDQLYDYETTNPRDMERQNEWNKFFKSTLNEYK